LPTGEPNVHNGNGVTEVYFFTEAERLLNALDILGIEDFRGLRVPIKLHMGEPGNNCYISPSVTKLIVNKLKGLGAEPFLFDTVVNYSSPRAKVDSYKKVAYRHGFGENEVGCKVVIGEEGVEVSEDGYNFEVAREIYESTHLVVLTHVKGHIQAGFGGAIKNLGMGGVTKRMKRKIHDMSIPRILVENCDLCGTCAEACPFHAITVDSEWRRDSVACLGCGKCVSVCPNEALSYEVMDLQKALALAAKACVRGKRVIYISALMKIASNCDCDPNSGPIICPDIGYLATSELAAVDRASLDLVDEVKPGIFEKVNQIDPSRQVQYAKEIGFTTAYELRRL